MRIVRVPKQIVCVEFILLSFARGPLTRLTHLLPRYCSFAQNTPVESLTRGNLEIARISRETISGREGRREEQRQGIAP